VAVARALLVLAFALLSVRAAKLSMFDQKAVDQGDAQSQWVLTLPPERGIVLDRSGATLALSVDAPSVYVEPQRIEDPEAMARALSRIFGLDRKTLEARLRERGSFRFVKRWVEPEEAERVRKLELAGLGIVHEPRRIYPHKTLAASLIGFANIDGQGVRGIEQQEDSWLRGTKRRLPMERDGSGKRMLKSDASSWGTSGGDVALTIDAALQSGDERALAETIARTDAKGGVVIVVDPHSGEILSLAESPVFDPNHFRTLDYDSTGSGAFLRTVEPGSSFKAFLVSAALEAGSLRPNRLVDCGDGTLKIPGKTIRDAKAYGWLDPAGILRVSSNVGAVLVAQDLGERRHFAMLERFGFGRGTGSQFPDESAGVLRPWREWKPLDHATIAFGQGVAVTPIQLAAATAVLANGGQWVRPRLVAARRVAEGRWQATSRVGVRRVIAPETARQVLEMMETVVSPEGTGRLAAIPGIRVAGKTGTAQKWDAKAGTYSKQAFRSWFIGIAPVEAPRIVVVVGLDEPKRPLHTGGGSAAPLFARVAEAHLARLGIVPEPSALPGTRLVKADGSPAIAVAAPQAHALPPAEEAAREPAPQSVAAPTPPVSQAPPREPAPAPPPVVVAKQAKPAPAPLPDFVQLEDRVLLPDLVGLTQAQVTRITDAGSLHVKFHGTGRAVYQEPPPGTVMPAGGLVSVELGTAAHEDARTPRTETGEKI
jgi:cell division protein FtsI (penicillin-binding protein 3)